jgi:hypothetical protein
LPDPDSPEHSCYQKLSKPGYYYNLYDHEDQLTELTRAVLPPLHQMEQTQPTSGPCSPQTDTYLPRLKSISEDNTAPLGGHHQPSLITQPVASSTNMLGGLSALSDDSYLDKHLSLDLISNSPYLTSSTTTS